MAERAPDPTDYPGADPALRAGNDDVAGQQRQDGGDVGDQLRDGGDHQLGRGVLHHLPVEPRLQCQLGGVGDFIRRDEPRAEAAGAGEVLAGKELAGMALPVADAALVVAGIARHVVQRLRRRDAAAPGADHHRQLTLEVELVRDGGLDQRLAVADLAAGEAGEQRGLLRHGAAGFLHVVTVIQADADDLVRIRNDGRELQISQGRARLLGFSDQRHLGQRARGKQRPQRRATPTEALAQVDDATVLDHAIPRPARMDERAELHGSIDSDVAAQYPPARRPG